MRIRASLVLLLASSVGSAEVAKLSLAEATARALAKNHEIGISKESFRIAGAQLSRANGAYDAGFHLDAKYRDHTDPVNSLISGAPAGADAPHQSGVQSTASLSQLLPTGATVTASAAASRDRTDSTFAMLTPSYSTAFGIDLRQPLLQNRAIDPARRAIRVARLERDRSHAALSRTVSETVAAVEKAYWTLVATDRDLSVRRQSVGLAEEQKGDTKSKIDAGVVPETELAQPTAEVERRKGELYAGEENVRRAENQLKTLILDESGDPLWGQPLEPTDAPDVAPLPVDLGAALSDAQARRPEVTDAVAFLARQDVEVQAAKDRVLPQLDVVASYTRRGLSGDPNPNPISFSGAPPAINPNLVGGFGHSFTTITENRFPDASIGVSLTLPVGNRVAKADAVTAEARKRQAALLLAQTKQRVAVEVRNAVVSLQTAAQRIEAARAGREAAETQLSAERERFAVGLSTNFFVLTRQNDLSQAKKTEIAALTDYRKAATELARATGTLLSNRNIEIEDAPASPTDGGSR